MCEILQSILSSQLPGVLIGALATGGFTLYTEWRKSVREDNLYFKRKREEVYLNILNIFYVKRNEENQNISGFMSNLPQLLEKNYPEINVYASKKVKEVYNQVMKKKDNQEELLIQVIRKELGIKD